MEQDKVILNNIDHWNCARYAHDNLKVISDPQLRTVKVKSKKTKYVLHTELKRLSSSTDLKTHDAFISR